MDALKVYWRIRSGQVPAGNKHGIYKADTPSVIGQVAHTKVRKLLNSYQRLLAVSTLQYAYWHTCGSRWSLQFMLRVSVTVSNQAPGQALAAQHNRHNQITEFEPPSCMASLTSE